MSTFRLDRVVPWGRSFDEYVAMFSLSAADLAGRVLGVADGPASFNAELTSRGGRVVSVDPLYAFSADEIRNRIEQTTPVVMDQARANRERFVWGPRIPSLEALERTRTGAMARFLDDYPAGRAAGRYVPGELPWLGLEGERFDLAVCSHFLFLYSDRFDARFHVEAIRGVLSLAARLRVFPLLDLGGNPAACIDGVRASLHEEGCKTRIERVDYEFQRGGDEMLEIERPVC